MAAATASPSLTQKIIALNLVAPMVLSQQAHGPRHARVNDVTRAACAHDDWPDFRIR